MKRITTLLFLLTAALAHSQIGNGLEASFSFNGNLADNSTSNIVCTNHGTGFAADYENTANHSLFLNGSSYVSFNSNAVKAQFPITISCYFKLDSLNVPQTLFSSDNDFGNYYGYWFNITNSGQLALNFSNAAGGQAPINRRSFATGPVLQKDQWYQAVGIIRASNDMSIYLDCNELAGTYDGTGGTNVTYGAFDSYIGNLAGAPSIPDGRPLYGSIDELYIWSRELTSNEIQYICDKNTLGLSENETERSNIYPNPTNGILNIRIGGNNFPYTITIMDNVGRTIENKTTYTETQQVDMTKYPAGLYTAIIRSAKGKSTQKFIKL